MTRSRFSIAAGLALSFTSTAAFAHVRFISPPPRHPTPEREDNTIKTAPCGVANDERTTDESRITVFEPGETITIEFAETIDHPGFYRVSFDDDGQDAFDAPLSRSDVQATPTLPVLLDDIADHGVGGYSVDVTLPNIECENCTLQLIQVMSGDQSWQPNDIYYTCADIALRGSGASGGNAGVGGMPGGAGMGGAGAGGMQAGAPPVAGAGSGGVTAGAGGVSAGTSGMGGMGGSSGSAPMAGASSGGMSAGGSAGTATGGVAGTVGTGGTGGVAAAGGAPSAGTAGTPIMAGVAGTATDAPAEEEPGCGFSTAPTTGGARSLGLLAAAILLLGRRRARR